MHLTPQLVVLFISGFRQGLGQPTGLEIMYDHARCRHGENTAVSIVPPLQWRMDWHAQAAFLARHVTAGNRHDRTRIVAVCYSWGVGWGFLRLGRELYGHGVLVDTLIAIDPVYRLPLLPPWLWMLSPEAMTSLGRIRVPANVGEVWSYRQFTNRPAGRECVASDKYRTVVHPAIELRCRHQQADDHPEVHRKVREVIDAAALALTPEEPDHGNHS